MIKFLTKTFLLTLSYLARKDCPFGNVTQRGVKRFLNNIFCLGIFFPPKIFLIIRPARVTNTEPVNYPYIAPTSKNPLFVYVF